MISSTLRIAWRNLGRNVRRTFLALTAIAVAQTAVLLMNGLLNGLSESMVETLTGPMLGHVQVHAPDWREEQAPDLVIEDLDARLSAIRALETVEQATARVYAPVLVAREVEGHAALIIGVDVALESAPLEHTSELGAGHPEQHHEKHDGDGESHEGLARF